MERRFKRTPAGIRDRPRRQSGVPVGVVRRVERQVVTAQVARIPPHALQGVDHGRIALQRHPNAQPVFVHGSDERAFLRPAGRNEPDRAIYASCPARGLLQVLEMWPRIRRSVPTATLDVYHGFNEVYHAMAGWYPGLLAIKAAVLQLLDQKGVTFHGMVGQDRLADGFARAGVWVYPTGTPETSCITAISSIM